MSSTHKPYPLSVQTFCDILKGGFVYVDKTPWIHRIVSIPKGAFFLSRPRRFGKSLLVSTLKALFLGKRELFRGLAIEKLPYAWESYPVIHLDLGDNPPRSPEELEENLEFAISREASSHGVKVTARPCHLMLAELIQELGRRGKAVVLIDEYDKPILGNIEDTPVRRRPWRRSGSGSTARSTSGAGRRSCSWAPHLTRPRGTSGNGRWSAWGPGRRSRSGGTGPRQ
ncbi:MAG: AAA family ATPase [Planctomycetes bacterium]|nr:AAA family ATPase [Planctomycetota bacterium]